MIQEPEYQRITDDWLSTSELKINPRTLSRYHSNGWVDGKHTGGKWYWRRRRADG